MLLRCKAGSRFREADAAIIGNLFERRTGPIGAAVKVSIDLPQER